MDNNSPNTKQSPYRFKAYIIGFIASLALTLSAYFLVSNHALTSTWLLVAVFALAISQLFVQLIFFLHLGRGSNARWNLMVLAFAAIVLLILVFGSLWIMSGLNYHMSSPTQLDKSIQNDEGIHK